MKNNKGNVIILILAIAWFIITVTTVDIQSHICGVSASGDYVTITGYFASFFITNIALTFFFIGYAISGLLDGREENEKN